MDELPFIFTIFFMLLGPIKLIPAFAGLTRGADVRFKRDVAIRATLIAAALGVFVALAGGTLLGKYRISIDALRIAGGLVLAIAALQVIFQKARPPSPGSGAPTAIQLAASPGGRSDHRAACRHRRHIDLYDACAAVPGDDASRSHLPGDHDGAGFAGDVLHRPGHEDAGPVFQETAITAGPVVGKKQGEERNYG